MHRTRSMLTVGLLAGALALAACGGDDDSSDSSAATATPTAAGATVAISAPADGALKFDQTDVRATAGTVTIHFDNPSSVPHAVEVEGNGIQEKATDTVTKGKASLT